MRTLAAAAAFALCVIVGLRKSAALKRRSELLAELRTMLRIFSIEIRCCALTLEELCERADGKFGELLRAARESCDDIRTAWDNACSEMTRSGYSGEEAELMRSLGKELGTSDCAGQEQLLELYFERISALYEAASADNGKKARLFRSVGFLCGAGAAVLLI